MKKTFSKLFVALALLAGSGVALADNDDGRGHGHGHDRDHGRGHDRWRDDRRYDRHYYRDDRRYYGYHHRPHYWARGERYYGPTYIVRDYGYYRLRPPPRGYHWVRDNSDYLLVGIATGIILDMAIR
ncbi:regulator RcnB of Ni and Co efflux [Dyella sp. OK004]|uniref:RcnB family protein n=1 Tax=Dyella sp. OK004 TaxID=1855292 RepID=UPI0008F16F97|nr:RcnB family protein [Dyella sp. OK004]SFS17885.1 regulator RcnB of Ni and Co efflux [Dyella sp. OK004]